ncbi:MAG: glucoamylase family protein [Acidobacteriota bacterium]
MDNDVFSLDRLQTRAVELAATHQVRDDGKRGFDLLARLGDNKNELIKAYRALTDPAQNEPLTPSAEWLVDNFHVVEDQLREVRQDLPLKFYRELPKLGTGIFESYPRIYHLALEVVTHTDNRLDAVTLGTFLEAYQNGQPLTIGEIWAFPISLRLALIENLRHFATRIRQGSRDRADADILADELATVTEKEFSGKTFDLLTENFDGGRVTENFSQAFLVRLAARLYEGEDFVGYALEKLQRRLRPEGVTLEHLAQREHSRQAAAQVSVANIITSMRLLSTLDWRDFFENASRVDRVLRNDPAKAYGEMDFATRDTYRRQIERIAKRTRIDEITVARRAVELAANRANDERKRHVGHFLIEREGLAEIEGSFNYTANFRERFERVLLRHPSSFYLVVIAGLTIIFLILTACAVSGSDTSTLALVFAVMLAVVPASELAVTIVNRTVNTILKPRLLPKMELKNGIPEKARTVVVVPTFLTDRMTIAELCGNLEVYYLANRDNQLFFALLGDLRDADAESISSDTELRDAARHTVAELNRKYFEPETEPQFLFFSRRREWNEGEGKWICPERKRGNLHAFSQLLRGKTDKTYDLDETVDFEFLKSIRYVITLDADTQLPRDAARKLIGTIEHPLNRPVLDAKVGRVTKGYAILQPRIEISLTSSLVAPFARIFSDGKGFDPYTTAVSDVYQDLFGEGSYVGKGLYDVDAFESALDRRVPKNKLLSHDLFEGLYARVALLTDIALYDDFPTTYESFAKRQHRWVRGDWQIAGWLLPSVLNEDGQVVKNSLPLIAKWKILDNLRRSLVAPALLLWLFSAWTFESILPLAATIFALIVLSAPLYLHVVTTQIPPTESNRWKNAQIHFSNLWADVKTIVTQLFFRFAFLVHEASSTTDAILRVSYRKMISGRYLLEWVTAAQSEELKGQDLIGYFSFMASSPIIAFGLFIAISVFHPEGLITALPFLAIWALAPFIAFRLSLPRTESTGTDELRDVDISWLRLAARRTWRYFEAFVGESEHWLPPDNFQQDPMDRIAHRTSPTNIGLLLLSTLAARDFGYTGTLETIERIELTCMTLERLRRFRGHFYNWYDTQTLEPLVPEYISTVDSGNLAGHLIAVAEGCLEFANDPLFGEHTIKGFLDAFLSLKSEVGQLVKGNLVIAPSQLSVIKTAIDEAEALLHKTQPLDRNGWQRFFSILAQDGEALTNLIKNCPMPKDEAAELIYWTTAIVRLADNCDRDLQMLVVPEPSSDRREQVELARRHFAERLESVARLCRRLSREMDFAFLYDDEQKVLTVGYRPAENVRDNSFYDLLASEARLASFIAVASGAVEQEHWFRLGRGLVKADGRRALVSWSGTMFEYLMPLLVMRNYERTLLNETYLTVVRRQIDYGKENNVAWGVSESAYNARDLQLNFQYAPFGVPGLGLKRGLAEDLVITPYATALALPLAPAAAIANLRRLADEGMFARYGFFEAVDYTRNRLPPKQISTRIETYMSHHQGMILVALDNVLQDNVMQKRFHREPMIESAGLLLQERVPRFTEEAERPGGTETMGGNSNDRSRALVSPVSRRYTSANQSTPQVCLLSNGNYTSMLTTAGSGFSRCGNWAVTRWREDVVRDDWGQYFYLRDVRSGAIWSTGFQPTLREPQDYEVTFTESKAEFRRRDAGISTRMEVIVATEDDAELRRITVKNDSSRTREIEITSYAEIVLSEQATDEAHLAFNKMFVETEYVSAQQTILARRRPRSTDESEVWGAQTVAVEGAMIGEVNFETGRLLFLGRNRTVQNPASVSDDTARSGTAGATLDPIFSFRMSFAMEPGESFTVVLSTVVAASRDKSLALADKYRDPNSFSRAEKLAWTRSQVELRHLSITTDEANLFQRLAGHLIYADETLRPRARVLKLNKGTQKDLWKYGIGGDLPLMIVRVSEGKDARSGIRQILRGHAYLHGKRLLFDLLILNDQPTSYEQSFNEDLQSMIRSGGMQTRMDTPGGIFLRRADIMTDADRLTLHTAARVCFVTERGTLEEELARSMKEAELPRLFIPKQSSRVYADTADIEPEIDLKNEFGGFTALGSEFRIKLEQDRSTPAPWSNVISNEKGFGFLTTETGLGVTWSNNSHENRLTGWSNDAVGDPPSECIFLRDEETGSFWTPTALPIRETFPYVITHGSGYSIFEHTSHGITQELLVFAPVYENVKISRLRLKNLTSRTRQISTTYFAELVLGVNRAHSAPFIITEIDSATGAILVKNPYNGEFADRIAFVASTESSHTWTCDRQEFIGRNGTLARPAAMLRTNLSGAIGSGMDPCAGLQTKIEIEPGETREIVFLLGQEDSLENARRCVSQYRQKRHVEEEFTRAKEFWNKTLGAVQIKTPDDSMNLMMNRWLLYQTLACRFWARTAFYQSSGAFGFRDQLQDSMALVYTRPDLARAHILRAAAHQFKEGDVEHWWHEPSNAGTRTRISDNLIWLIYVVCFYAEKTGETDIFDEVVPFLDAPVLAIGEMETYIRPIVSGESGTIFEHCVRALEISLPTGSHGLPLIGAGDWSDGLNRVGVAGKGESVWLAWFLAKSLNDFSTVCDQRNEVDRAEKYRGHAKLLIENLEESAWDGDWYIRAFFDDGVPLGSKQNDESRIDSISQSWSVISGKGKKERAELAMRSVDEHLIKREEKLLLLLDPPFDKGVLEPGYIKGYPPGIRENGGQYTHAAAWTIIAFALLGDGEKAHEIFSLLNPINHTRTNEDVAKYRTEPYAVAADIYSNPMHVGQGGWTWYTGAAGWMYRAALENILGFKKTGDTLSIEPCIPREWKEFEIVYSYRSTIYQIKVENPHGVRSGIFSAELDGKKLSVNRVELVDDGETHAVRIMLGAGD